MNWNSEQVMVNRKLVTPKLVSPGLKLYPEPLTMF